MKPLHKPYTQSVEKPQLIKAMTMKTKHLTQIAQKSPNWLRGNWPLILLLSFVLLIITGMAVFLFFFLTN
ncbi:hypothetical protein DIU36_17650 [Mucilaginibacter rubeus]|nr:hypothetical protein DIU36_17650 [Mucilaginibacter rubeus]